jgi:beta-N-acetylhexosaminidase
MQASLMVDIAGLELNAADRLFLMHPAIGGVVLFARNYAAPTQLRDLCAEIHALRAPPLKIAVDHEGGRVQRFHDGFTAIVPMADIGATDDPKRAEQMAFAAGLVIATELSSAGMDLSFAPVIDLSVGDNAAIGTRAFGADPSLVGRLGLALARGLGAGGFPAVAKHFPGHGSIRADSHVQLPRDDRGLAQIESRDLQPFKAWIAACAGGLMTAHIKFPAVCAEPVTFSQTWIQQLLRTDYGFDGLLFSDDLGMAAAREFADTRDCAESALRAGCDVVMVCNDRVAAEQTAEHLAASGAHYIDSAALHSRSEKFWRTTGGASVAEVKSARALLAQI